MNDFYAVFVCLELFQLENTILALTKFDKYDNTLPNYLHLYAGMGLYQRKRMSASSTNEKTALNEKNIEDAPPSFFMGILRVLLIPFLRFHLLARLWCVVLVGVNAYGLVFLPRVEAIATLGAVALGVLYQAALYQKIGFTRLGGTGHTLFIPLVFWLALFRLPLVDDDDLDFANWMKLLISTNSLCIMIDLVDFARYLRGERSPHYEW